MQYYGTIGSSLMRIRFHFTDAVSRAVNVRGITLMQLCDYEYSVYPTVEAYHVNMLVKCCSSTTDSLSANLPVFLLITHQPLISLRLKCSL